nr:hypothetical protein [Rickettsia endosymbiont of Ceutorhynchus assimilis]
MIDEEEPTISVVEEKSEEEYKEEKRQRNARVWKDTKDMFKIIIPALIVVMILMRILNSYLIERHAKEMALEDQQIEAELDAEEAAEKLK